MIIHNELDCDEKTRLIIALNLNPPISKAELTQLRNSLKLTFTGTHILPTMNSNVNSNVIADVICHCACDSKCELECGIVISTVTCNANQDVNLNVICMRSNAMSRSRSASASATATRIFRLPASSTDSGNLGFNMPI